MSYKLILILLLTTTTCFSQTVKNDGALVTMSNNVLLKLSDGSIQNENNGMFKGEGSILCNGFINNSNISVSNDQTIGILSINGTLDNQASSSISLKIEGTNGEGIQGGNDILTINGDLQLNNTLNVSFTEGFMPENTDEFTIITYTGNLTNVFQEVNIQDLTGDFQIDYDTPGVIKLKSFQLSVEDYNLDTISVFPNPASNFITIKASQKISEISIYNLLGQMVSKPKFTNTILDVSNLSKGMYLLNIEMNNTTIVTKKIIIK